MNRFRLAISATLLGVVLASGCASPCGGCDGCGGFRRMSLFRGRRACCPAECCSNCGGGAPIVGGGGCCGGEFGDGPLLEPPGGAPFSAIPPSGAFPPATAFPAPGGAAPGPFPPSLGAPLGTPNVPVDPRFAPMPNGAQPVPAEASSRMGRR